MGKVNRTNIIGFTSPGKHPQRAWRDFSTPLKILATPHLNKIKILIARKKGRIGMEQSSRKICTVIFFSGFLTLYIFTSLPRRTHSTFALDNPCFLVSYSRNMNLANVIRLTVTVEVFGWRISSFTKWTVCSGSPACDVRLNTTFHQRMGHLSRQIFLPPRSQRLLESVTYDGVIPGGKH